MIYLNFHIISFVREGMFFAVECPSNGVTADKNKLQAFNLFLSREEIPIE